MKNNFETNNMKNIAKVEKVNNMVKNMDNNIKITQNTKITNKIEDISYEGEPDKNQLMEIITEASELDEFDEFIDSDIDYEDASDMASDSETYSDNGSPKSNSSKNKDLEDCVDIDLEYRKEIRSKMLLSPEEEVELGKKVQLKKIAESQLNSELISYMSPEEIDQLKEIVKLGIEARNTLVESNYRLSYKLACKYSPIYHMDRLDLAQAGNLGLITAADKYNPEMGFRFSTYATWWIKQSMTRERDKTSSSIKLPVHKNELFRKINTYKSQVFTETGKYPSEYQIFYFLNKDKIDKYISAYTRANDKKPSEYTVVNHFSKIYSKFLSLLQCKTDVCSLDTYIDEDESTSLMDMVSDDNALIPEKEYMKKALKEDLNKVMDNLPERQAMVLKMHYGLGFSDSAVAPREMTLEEIGKKINVSRERVRQIKEQAFVNIRKNPWMKEILEPYFKG
ncbi:MAG: RNA polymerase sigma factor RpoD/SigA [Eubacterium sp.]|nr:RNA polymerase sigma factor RpoD/SigA [Eubacterium sp.]